jgi:hypothetical protein
MWGLFTVAGPNTYKSKYPKAAIEQSKSFIYLLQHCATNTSLITGPSRSLYIFGCRCQQSYSLRPRVPPRFNITTSNQTHESRRFVVVHNQIRTTNGLFCLPDGGSYDIDVTIHLNIPESTINTKKWLTPFKFSTVFTLRNVYTVSNTGLNNIHRYNIKNGLPDLNHRPSELSK